MTDDPESVDFLRDHVSEDSGFTSSDSVVAKSGLSRSLVGFACLCIAVGLGITQLAQPETERLAIQIPPTATTVVAPSTTVEPIDAEPDDRIPLPDRGGMRTIVEGWLAARCDQIIDGPEPLLNTVYEEHLECLEVEMVKLDQTCFLAARHYYQYPGDEALEVACSEPLPNDL